MVGYMLGLHVHNWRQGGRWARVRVELHCCKAGVRSGGATCYESDTTSSELHACYMLQGDHGHERSHMRKAGKGRWSHMLQGDTIAGGELHYCGAGASTAGKLLRQTLGRDGKRCVTCATCCEAVVQLPRAEPADARGCGLSNQPGCRQSRVHRTAWTMESRSLCVFFYCLCTTWSLESRSRLGQGYFMCSTAGSMESRSLSSTRTQQHYITLLHFDTGTVTQNGARIGLRGTCI